MIKLFFLNESILHLSYAEFLEGVLSVVEIERDSNDDFLKHDSIYNCENYINLCSVYSYESGEVLKYLEQLSPSHIYLYPQKLFDENYGGSVNGYLGVDFSRIVSDQSHYVLNKQTYTSLRNLVLSETDFRDLWGRKEEIFKNIVLCGEVKEQISKIGKSSYFNQIFEKLQLFDNAINDWQNGDFNYNHFNKNYALRISPESDSTMNKFGNERIFSLPNGGTEIFDLHIKTGDIRFHFYPDSTSRKVFIGYIGPHLRTVSN